jgi:pSer/pThr/pTyr-binding forkhead associated (FHA) protein
MSPAGIVTFPLPATGEISIGRSPDADVQIDDAKASRRHALVRLGEHSTVEDLNSSNGTRVGDGRLPPNVPVELRTGMMITIGSTVLLVQAGPNQSPGYRLLSQGAL